MSEPRKPAEGSVWQHQSGTDYRVLGYTMREADGEELITYTPLAGGTHWSRPLREFLADKDGKPRFVERPQTPPAPDTGAEEFAAKYPNLHLEAQAKASGSQEVGRFLDWLQEQNLLLARYEEGDYLEALPATHADIMYKFYGINRKAAEKERSQLLDAFIDKRRKDCEHGS